jgi:hypothetical protein
MLRKLSLSGLSFLIALAMLCGGAHAAEKILLNDTWADADRTNTNLPTDSPTWIGQSAGNGSNSVTAGSLNFVVPTNSMKVWEYFTSDQSAPDGNQPHNSVTHLNVGDTLTATVTFTLTGTTSTSTSRNFRFGLFNDPTDARVLSNANSDAGNSGTVTTNPWTDALGYNMWFAISTGTVTNFQLGKRTAANSSLLGSTGAYTVQSGGSPFSFVDATSYSAQMSVKIISNTQSEVTGTLLQGETVLSTSTKVDAGVTFATVNNVGSITVGDQIVSNKIYRDFDQLFFRNSDATQMTGLSFTNWKVALTTNPPPIVLGDADRDGTVGTDDIQALLKALVDLSAYKTRLNVASDEELKMLLDINGDNKVANSDIQPLLNMLATAGFGSVATVPEPSTSALIALGSLGLVLLRRRNARAA